MASMSPLARPMVHTAAVWYFWILQRIYELALTYPLCALLVGTELGSEDYLAPYKRLVVLPISASILRWTNASGMIIVLLRSEIPSGICAKLRTVAASNNRVHMPWSLCYCLFAPHICMVLFFTHIPFVVNHTFIATPPERLQQYAAHSVFACPATVCDRADHLTTSVTQQ